MVDGKIVFQFPDMSADGMDRIYAHLNVSYPRFYKMDNLSKLGFLASEFLFKDGLRKNHSAYDYAIVLSNAGSSLDTDLKYIASTQKAPSPALFVYTLPNIVNGEISIRHGFKGESNFFITSSFDPQFISDYCNQLLDANIKTCIAGWVEFTEQTKEVFLYLVNNEKNGLALDHTSENILKIYSL